MLLKMLVGGAMAGGAAGLATSYGNQIRDLNDAANESVEDPVIEIPSEIGQPLNTKMAGADIFEGKEAAPPNHVNRPPGIGALALALPTLGIPAVLSYAAARKMYQKHKKEELERELGDSQEAYQEALSKMANSPLSDPEGRPLQGLENWGMLAAGAVPLSGLAAAYMTNKLLDRSFPVAKKPKSTKIRIRRQAPEPPAEAHDSETAEEGPIIDVEGEEIEKEAAWLELDRSDATEFLVRTVLGNEKVASVSQLPALLLNGSVDHQRTSNIFLFRGPEAGFDHVKEASGTSWSDTLDRAAGISLMTKSAAVGPTVALLAAAEFADAHPMLCSQARAIDPRVGEELEKFAALNGAIARAADVQMAIGEAEDLEKQAAEHTADVDLVMLTQFCMEKRSFVAGPAKVDKGEATAAGALGGILGPLGAGAVSGIHSGVETDSIGSAARSAFGAGGGSLLGGVGGGLAGLALSKLLDKLRPGPGFDPDGDAAAGFGRGLDHMAISAQNSLPVPIMGLLGSMGGGALGSRWAAGRHNDKQEAQDERQAQILSSLKGGDEQEAEKAANADVPTHDALQIAESRSSVAAEEENNQGDDPVPEASEQEDIVDKALTELAGVAT